MDPDRTTTMGDGESEMTERPFHIMNAVDRIRPKFRIWAAACRGFPKEENMLENCTRIGFGEIEVMGGLEMRVEIWRDTKLGIDFLEMVENQRASGEVVMVLVVGWKWIVAGLIKLS